MALRCRVMAGCTSLLVFAGALGTLPLHAFRQESEQDLRSHIEREHDPVKRAKLEIRLARVLLSGADGPCVKDDHAACQKALEAYLEQVRGAWKDLQSSGKNAVKQPSGFREVDIALREQGHEMEDMKRRLPFEDRDELDPVMKEADAIHTQVFNALFPTGSTRSKGAKPAPHFGANTDSGQVQ